jgi:tetratricopeptide (TPR) repeat protein
MRRMIVLLAIGGIAGRLQSQTPHLGTISFPTSGPPAAQEAFVRGVLWLHSFEYDSAAHAFRDAQRLAPDFAMAYWGEAMTYNHPVWNERDQGAALAALRRLGPTPAARRAKAPTHREQMYLEAAESLWADGPKAQRDTAYEQAMERLVRAHPEDVEARAFEALAILGLSQGTRVVPSYLRAAAIAEEIFRDNPDHPGAAHYLIHAYDDPQHAQQGLPAARAYSRIAPDAPHAQHMTTHIFMALGMWDQVVSQNVIASGTHLGPGHYTAWWDYGLLQLGRLDSARALLVRARQEMHPGPRPVAGALAVMRAHYVIDAERWDDSVLQWSIDLAGAGGVVRAIDAFTQGYAALKRGDLASARTRLVALDSVAGAAITDAYGASGAVPAILARELRAALLFADGQRDSAVALARAAAASQDALPFDFGPPDIVKPTHELLGEMLLTMGRAADAQHEFERALALAPGRARALAGLAAARSGGAN